MEKKLEICEYRDKLDKTLASPELTDEQTLKNLIRSQLNEECNEDVLRQKAANLSNILEKLRSASTKKDHELSGSSNEGSTYGDWKVKHDDEDCRVMYREGEKGSPFHTLLVEGYVDGPVEDCLCVSWESSLYDKWWPKSKFPAFKILESKCLQKFRIDEQICLVRMKVPWPMRDREAIVHFFSFEYFKDGLVVILLNSISSPAEVESINKEGIAEAGNAVRIDLVGGVAIQKVNPHRSYVRSISELDIKLDLVPPSFINFMSRQLLGNGFRFFKKTIGSVADSDDYSRVLADPLYTKIRQALYFADQTDEICEANQEGRVRDEIEPEELVTGSLVEENCENEETVHFERDIPEIEEEECDDEEEDKSVSSSFSFEDAITKKTEKDDSVRSFCISPQVKEALGTLDTVISIVKKSKTDNSEEEEEIEEIVEVASSSTKHQQQSNIASCSKVFIQDPKLEFIGEASLIHYRNNSSRRSGSISFAREGNKVAPASPEIELAPTYHEVPRITVSEAITLFSQTPEDSSNEKPSGLIASKSSFPSQRQRKPPQGCFCFRPWMRRKT